MSAYDIAERWLVERLEQTFRVWLALAERSIFVQQRFEGLDIHCSYRRGQQNAHSCVIALVLGLTVAHAAHAAHAAHVAMRCCPSNQTEW